MELQLLCFGVEIGIYSHMLHVLKKTGPITHSQNPIRQVHKNWK